MLLMVEVVHCH